MWVQHAANAKLKGEGVDAGEPEVPERTNVVDLMAALKKSLGEEPEKKPAPAKKKAAAARVRKIGIGHLTAARPMIRTRSRFEELPRCWRPALTRVLCYPPCYL
jgi:hypothetical protein